MSEINTGGPAFPLAHEIPPEPGRPEGTRALQAFYGMTLRDYFAAKAMQALLHKNYFDVAAKEAYQMADAMLKARGQ